MDKFTIRKLEGYTIMSNHHLRDQNITHGARGLLSFMLSLPENWDYSFNGLVAISKEGKSAIRTLINELKEAKYVKITQYRDEKGYFQSKYEVFEIPYDTPLKMQNYPTPDYRVPDNRISDEPMSENQPQINTKEINTNKQIDNKDKIDIYSDDGNFENLKLDGYKNHHVLTQELFNLEYITPEDNSSFLFDDLFKEYIDKKISHKKIYFAIHYIVPNVVKRNFKDDNGKDIENKYAYLKKSLDTNLNRKREYEELYPEDENSDFYKDFLRDFER